MASRTEVVFQSPSAKLHSSVADNFSLARGGLIHRLSIRFGGAREQRVRTGGRTLVALAVTWLPLLLLSAMQGSALGDQIRIPFIKDFAVNSRFLIALPLLILSEAGIDQRLRSMVKHFLEMGLVKNADLPSFERVLAGVTSLGDRVLPEVVLVTIAFLPAWFAPGMETMITSVSSWHLAPSGGTLSYAGWWFSLLSAPFFRFLLLRWLWRMLLWALLIWRVSRLNLALVPAHPDRAAGLGFLSHGQVKFGAIAFAVGAVMAGRFANLLAYQGATLTSLKFIMIAYCLSAVVVLVAPLLLLAPKLLQVKKLGREEYGVLASDYNHMFDAKWVHGRPPQGETLLGSSDIQSLADLNNSYAAVRQISVIPIQKDTLMVLALLATLPLVPVLIAAMPVDQLLRTLLKFLA
jgi:hypothetical protein